MANIRRLIFKRFGGTSNFLSYMLLTIIVYLLIRSYTQSDVDVIEAAPSIEAPKGGGKILLTDKKIAKEETEKSPKVLPQPEVFDKGKYFLTQLLVIFLKRFVIPVLILKNVRFKKNALGRKFHTE